MKLPTLCLALLAATALAQGKPTLIDYPLDVKTAITDAQQTVVQDDFRQMLARNSGILLPTRSNWQAAHSALKRQDCDVRNECLRQLATTAGTLYALYASLERNAAGTDLTATGRVVNQDGVQVRAPISVMVKKKGSFEEAAHDALVQLITKLELDKLSPVLTQAPVEPKAELKQPEPAPEAARVVVIDVPQAEKRSSAPRTAGFVIGGLAVVSAGFSVGFGVSASGMRGGLPSDGVLLNESQVRGQRAVNQRATLALASGVTAAVLAITSITLLAVSPSDTPSVSFAPIPGGAAMVVGGQF